MPHSEIEPKPHSHKITLIIQPGLHSIITGYLSYQSPGNEAYKVDRDNDLNSEIKTNTNRYFNPVYQLQI